MEEKIRNELGCVIFNFGKKAIILSWQEVEKHGESKINLLSIDIEEKGISLTLNGVFQKQFMGEIKEVFDFFEEFIKTDPRNK